MVGSNGVADGAELGQPEARDDPLERVGDGLEAAVQLAVLAGPVDGVEHLGDRGERGVRRVLADQLAVAVDPALVVDVLGLQPLQVGGPLGQLRVWRDGRARRSARRLGSPARPARHRPPAAVLLRRARGSGGRSAPHPRDAVLVVGRLGHLALVLVGVGLLVDDLGVDDVVVGLARRAVAATGGGRRRPRPRRTSPRPSSGWTRRAW